MTLPVSTTVTVAGDWPLGFDQPLPRRVRLRTNVRYGIMGFVGGMLALTAFLSLVASIRGYQTSRLTAHGVFARGTVHALLVIQGRGGPGYQVIYDFTDPAPPDPIEALQSAKDFVTEAQFRRLTVGDAVGVVFLPRRPDISTLEITLAVASRDPWAPLRVITEIMGLLSLAGGCAFALFYWNERLLLQWGCHTTATVVAIKTVDSGRRRNTHAEFEFYDTAGKACFGVAHYVGTTNQQIVGPATRSYAAGDTAIALFSSSNPARADLYPLQLLTLASSPPRL